MRRLRSNRCKYRSSKAFRQRELAKRCQVKGLYFSKPMLEKVLAGEKTTTLRSYRVKPGMRELRTNRHRPHRTGQSVMILSVRMVHVSVLTERVARLEGFSSLEELRAFLSRQYPGRAWFWLHELRLLPMERR